MGLVRQNDTSMNTRTYIYYTCTYNNMMMMSSAVLIKFNSVIVLDNNLANTGHPPSIKSRYFDVTPTTPVTESIQQPHYRAVWKSLGGHFGRVRLAVPLDPFVRTI